MTKPQVFAKRRKFKEIGPPTESQNVC